MSWVDAQSLALALEETFGRILEERMHGLPLVNPQLAVKALGFRTFGDYWLGVLITPWFMNLMLVPQQAQAISELRCGDKCLHQFPAGAFEFTVGEEAGIGRYQSCSLFSPMFEFGEQQVAELTAAAALQNLLAQPQIEAPATISRRDLLRGAFARGHRYPYDAG